MTTAHGAAQCVDLLDPVETEILRAYFGLRTKLPPAELLAPLAPPDLGDDDVSGEDDDHATFFPQFRRHVVTASVDCAETWGATDFAIGVVKQRENFLEGCGRVIRGWWRFQRQLGDQPPWAFLLHAGIVGRDAAYEWKLRTWGREACTERRFGW